jgi:hypothetical protein
VSEYGLPPENLRCPFSKDPGTIYVYMHIQLKAYILRGQPKEASVWRTAGKKFSMIFPILMFHLQ